MTETWYTPAFQHVIPDFTLVAHQPRSDTDNGHSGGSAIYIKNSPHLECKYSTQISPSPDCNISIAVINDVTFVVIYRSPNQSNENILKLSRFIKSLDYEKMVVCGDLNIPHADWNSMSCNDHFKNKIIHGFSTHGLVNHVHQATHILGNLLDVVLSDKKMIFDVEIGDEWEFPSDHLSITFAVTTTRTDPSQVRHINLYKDFRIDEYNERLRRVNWFQINYEDVDEAVEEITKIILTNYNECLPKRYFSHGKSAAKFSPRILAQISACKHFKRSNKKDELERARVVLDELIQESKQNNILKYLEGLEADKFNIYSEFKKNRFKNKVTCTRRADGSITYDQKEVVEILNDQFASVLTNSERSVIDWDCQDGLILDSIEVTEDIVLKTIKSTTRSYGVGPDYVSTSMLLDGASILSLPLTILYRRVLSTSVVPKQFRVASVTPIPKKNDSSWACNLRPICKESNIGKTLEKIVQQKMYETLEAYDYFPSSQYGFRKKMGCAQNLEEFHSYIQEALNNGFKCAVCFTDLSKAFDVADHNMVLQAIFKAGIRGQIGRYIEAWLSGRTQFTRFREENSSTVDVNSSIVQGSNLATLLFLCLKNNLPSYIKHCLLVDFADDSKLALKFKDNSELWAFEEDIRGFQQWAKDAKQCLNLSKTKILIFGGELKRNLYVNNRLMNVSKEITDLGLDTSSVTGFLPYQNKVFKKVSLASHAAKKSISGASFKIRSFIWITYIYPIYNYVPILWQNQSIATRLDDLWKRFFQDSKPAEGDIVPLCPSQSFMRADLVWTLNQRKKCESTTDWFRFCTGSDNHGRRLANDTNEIPPLPDRHKHRWPVTPPLHRAREAWNVLAKQSPKITLNDIDKFVRSEESNCPGHWLYEKLLKGELRSQLQRLRDLQLI